MSPAVKAALEKALLAALLAGAIAFMREYANEKSKQHE